MRKFGSAVLAAALFASTATFAGTNVQDQGTLAPGSAAGVQKAQALGSATVMTVVGIAIAAALIAVVASNSNGGSSATTTTGVP
ncbi:MAG: hypothetical protein WBQ17_03880 [Rhizomicrobium sp.]|jgi:hypothetical protein